MMLSTLETMSLGVYGVLAIAILRRLFYGLAPWWEGLSSAYGQVLRESPY
jgi:hypothetical protein